MESKLHIKSNVKIIVRDKDGNVKRDIEGHNTLTLGWLVNDIKNALIDSSFDMAMDDLFDDWNGTPQLEKDGIIMVTGGLSSIPRQVFKTTSVKSGNEVTFTGITGHDSPGVGVYSIGTVNLGRNLYKDFEATGFHFFLTYVYASYNVNLSLSVGDTFQIDWTITYST
jgi:hypothetical protein